MRAIVPLQPAGHASVFSEDNGPLELSGNNRLVKDSVAKLRLEGRRRHEVDLVANKPAQPALQADEFKEANRPAELNEQIDIAILSTFIAGERTEEPQTGNTEGIQQRAAIT
jgi:hypothetical protein